jgi:tetratricopeptide (TPR) repeat protein
MQPLEVAMNEPTHPVGLIDVMVADVTRVDASERVEEAIGQDIVGDAEQLRARFLERVALAQTRALTPNTISEASQSEKREPAARLAASNGREPSLPSKIGRYPILRRLGAGGMGVVYAAYDEVLDRRLAIKVLHSHAWDADGRRRERLLREAQAMARVSHPNLITVHEVGTAEAALFIAMEFVSGPTLKPWLAKQPRSWREVVAVFIQIADGLSALHDAGLVHRDVKPANLIIGDDGRVRVLDLGLVGANRDDSIESGAGLTLEESSSFNRIGEPLTKTGERLGTPAYMSREQFLGLELTPASDTFAFSIMLHEALFDAHPFMKKGATFYELQTNVVDNKLVPPPSSSQVPAWLAALVASGLAPDPKDRPASMRAYAQALTHDPSRTRRRSLATVGVALVAAIAGVVLARSPASEAVPSCDGAEQVIAQVWNEARAEEVRAAMLATDRSYAAPLADRITSELDDYAAAWASAHTRTCEEHARGDHSAALLDARMACLHHGRQVLAETVSLLSESNPELVTHAGQMVAKLPRLEPCDDLAALSSRASSRPAETSDAIAELEDKLVRVEALANAGRNSESIALARTVVSEAQAIDASPTVAAALLAEARASIVLSSDSTSMALLERALAIAIVEGLDPLAAEAMSRRIYLRGLTSGGSAAALADLPIAEAMLVRAGSDSELRALLENNAGAVHLAAGDRVQARAAFGRALALKQRLFGEDHLELAVGLANLAILTDDEQARRELHRRMINIYETRLGPGHPRTLDARLFAAMQMADPQGSGAALRDLCPRLWAIDEPRLATQCEIDRGRIEFVQGRIEFGRDALEQVRAELDEGDARAALLDAYLAIGTDAAAAAIPKLAEQIAAVDKSGARDWWVLLDQAERRVVLAWLLADADPTATIVSLERAIGELEQLVEHAPPIERERLLALARSTLARTLVLRGELERVPALVSEARAFYQRWPSAYATRLTELDSLSMPVTLSMEP